MERLIKKEVNKVILENDNRVISTISTTLESSQAASLIPAHRNIYDKSPSDVQSYLKVTAGNRLKSGDLGYSYSVVENMVDILTEQYGIDEYLLTKLVHRMNNLVTVPVFNKLERHTIGSLIRSEIFSISDKLDSNEFTPIIHDTILEILVEERKVASQYHEPSSMYVQEIDNGLYILYLYDKMLKSKDLNGDDISDKDGYIDRTISRLPTLEKYMSSSDHFVFSMYPQLKSLLDPRISERRVIDPDVDHMKVNFSRLQSILEEEKDYLLSDIESTMEDIIYSTDGTTLLYGSKLSPSRELNVFTDKLDGVINSSIVINSANRANRNIYLRSITCTRKDIDVIITTIMDSYCKHITNRYKGITVNYCTTTVKDQKGEEIRLLEIVNTELNKSKKHNIYIVSLSKSTRNIDNETLILSLLQIYHNGKVNKLTPLTRTEGYQVAEYNIKNISRVIYVKPHVDIRDLAMESISGSFYLDEKEGKFRYAKKIKYNNIHKEFNDTMFYLKSSRRMTNVALMKTSAVKLMDILLYTEAYIYDDKTKKYDIETKKYISLRANVISELHKTLEDISKVDGEFNFHDYYLLESKSTRSFSVNSFVRAAISLLGELVNQSAGVLRKPFM